MSEPQREIRVFLSCKACGHWKKGPMPDSEMIDWLRVHRCAGVDNAPHLTVLRESSCPDPCTVGMGG